MAQLRRCDNCGELQIEGDPGKIKTRLCAECGSRLVEDESLLETQIVNNDHQTGINPPEGQAIPTPPSEEPTVGGPPSDAEQKTAMIDQTPHPEPTSKLPGGTDADPSPAPPMADPPTSEKTSEKEYDPDTGKFSDSLIGRKLGGYLIKKKLGQGGMGAVYLARQVSLDRDVALKTLPAKLARDPSFVARFTREALTAAQLNHHNIVQVIDVGSEGGVHYISMEFVKGIDLGKVTRNDGRLPFEEAAGYVLQAARGLDFAHRRGIIHRDIKPDNLMINDLGVVKVADMGLAKMKGQQAEKVGLDHGAEDELKRQAYSDLTGVNAAMGTPSYMSPEQGRDAGGVDHRSDQYSLGCTLYYLVAGKAPFTGRTSFEIISKHLSEPLQPLDAYVKNVPRDLSLIIEKMLAKDPEQRFPSLGAVVETLEAYLGIDSSKGPYTPREHHAALLEMEQRRYYEASVLKLKKIVPLTFFGATALLFVICALVQQFFLAAAFLGLLILAPLSSFIIGGFLTKNFLFRRVRSVFFGMSMKGWAITAISAIVGAAVLYVFGLLIPWVFVSVLAVGLAFGYQMFVAGKLREERAKPLRNVQDMLKQLRTRGVSEEAIQDFVCRFGSEHWEEFFEDLFGYEDMILQRSRWATREKVRPRKKFATWRDPLVRWLDEIEDSRRRARERRALAKAEKARLKAEGVSEAEAEAQAEEIAEQGVEDLIETVITEAEPSAAEKEKAAKDLNKSAKKAGPGIIPWVFRFVRLVVALGMIGAFGAVVAAGFGVPIPESIGGLLNDWYFAYGPPFRLLGAAAGVLLLITVFSKRVLLPGLVFIGAIGFVYYKLVASIVPLPEFTDVNVYIGTALLTVAGFVLMILTKLGGGKF